MTGPYVRTIGTVTDIDGVACPVGVDHDTVTIGTPGCSLPFRFTRDLAEEFGRLFAAAYWQAGCNARQLAEETYEADGGDTMHDTAGRIHELEQLAADILATYTKGQDGYRGRVGQMQIQRWQTTLKGTP
jgi:hypothetical protein